MSLADIMRVMVDIGRGVETEMRACYDEWDIQMNRRHMERYHSMLLKCLAWINGKARAVRSSEAGC